MEYYTSLPAYKQLDDKLAPHIRIEQIFFAPKATVIDHYTNGEFENWWVHGESNSGALFKRQIFYH